LDCGYNHTIFDRSPCGVSDDFKTMCETDEVTVVSYGGGEGYLAR